MKLNTQQRTAAEHDGGHALVLAGAGTGKTSTIVGRAAHLLKTGVEAERILLLTFTRRAAKEMVSRLEAQVGPQSRQIVAGTFHHFCLLTMRRMPKLLGLAHHTVIDRDDQVELMKLARVAHAPEGRIFPKAQQLVSLHSYARNTNRPPREHLEKHTDHDEQAIELILRVFADYAERKKASRYLDYDDILFSFAKRLHEHAECRRRVQGLYDHVLVDEMQDTNPLQWLILEALRDPAKLFCVGDDAQSIYAFRGADFQNVHAFTERVPGAQVLKLERNYRSTQPILDLANWLLARSPLGYDKKLVASRGTGDKPRLLDFDSDFDEAAWLAGDLMERHEAGAEWREHMILTRTGWGARAVEAGLVEHEIPYRFVGGTSLLQSAHVKDLLALLRALDSPQDELAWMRYLTLWPGIGDRTAARLMEQVRGCPGAEEAIGVIERQCPRRTDMVACLRKTLAQWLKPTDAVRAAGAALAPLLESKYERWDVRKRDFDLLRRLATNHRAVRAFIETYILDPVSESVAARTDQEDAVTLITVHSAKGAEARVCYVIQAQPGMYPHIRSLGDREAEEEERRILYVALTRAKDELNVTRTVRFGDQLVPHGGRRAQHSDQGQAYFLEDVPETLVDAEAVVDADDADEVIRPFNG